jgi:hypothetical protein
MIVALIDNGSLEPAAHRNLRSVADAVSFRTGVKVRAVSWKHSDRISDVQLDGTPAWILEAFVRSMFALGQREFVFVPFFISPQGAIGSALRRDLDVLRQELGDFDFTFTEGLAALGVIPSIVAERVHTCISSHRLLTPPVIVVDHGGPSAESASVRDELVGQIRVALGGVAGPIEGASMEGIHPPLLADLLTAERFADGDVVVAPLFLSPGRHAGPTGDVAQICGAARSRSHVTGLIGTHPLVVDAFAGALRTTLSNLQAHSFA